MMPVEWPIAAPAADPSVAPARVAGADRLAVVRADFFLNDEARLTEQERALMGALLAGLIDQLVDELAVALPHALADRVELVRSSLLRRLWDSGGLNRPRLVALLLRRSDEERLSSAGSGGPVEALVGDDDPAIAAAAMALTVARGRRKDRFGRLGVEFDDLPAEEAGDVAFLVAASVRGALAEVGAIHDQAFADAAAALIARHDEGNRLDARLAALAYALHDAGRGTDELVAGLAEAREIALLSALLSARAGIEPDTGWRMMVEQGAPCAVLLAKLAGLDRQGCARLLAALSEPLAIHDPAAAIAEFDQLDSAQVEAHRRWLRLPQSYRLALDAVGADDGQRA